MNDILMMLVILVMLVMLRHGLDLTCRIPFSTDGFHCCKMYPCTSCGCIAAVSWPPVHVANLVERRTAESKTTQDLKRKFSRGLEPTLNSL